MNDNYDKMTDKTLNVKVGKRLGYHVIHPEGFKCYLADSNGYEFGSRQMTEADCWLDLKFAINDTAALELVKDIDYSVSHHTDSYFVHMHGVRLNKWGDRESYSVHESNARFARALTICWLRWQDANIGQAT